MLFSIMIHLLKKRASTQQIHEMLEALDSYIKLAVDIKQGFLAGGGVLHADCEAVLLEDGSQQKDIWGADWIPATQKLTFEAFINIRPKQHNRSMIIENAKTREIVAEIAKDILGGV